jgi:CheY-like chemotaxis protein
MMPPIEKEHVEKSVVSNIQKQLNTSIKKKSVLIIDDTADLLELQKTVLEMDDFEVFTAQSGDEAFKILAQIDQPDLILLDVRMDDMSGPEFLELLEKKMPEIMNLVPVAFLTAMNEVPEGRVVGFIRKPFDVEKFLEAVHRFIDMGQLSTLKH